ncbi:hypothetical protein A5699_16250 [Mycobacterium sp. E802]|nr:hypothetical protein A5699_16250 [Mycobacterium sp. E802]
MLFLPLGDDLKQQLRSAWVNLDITELIQQKKIQPCLAGHHTREDTLVGGFDEFIDQLRAGDVTDLTALLTRSKPQPDE